MRGKIIPYNERHTHRDAEWLGSLPAHWTVTRAKNLLRESDERSATGDEEQLSVSHLTGVTPRSEKNVTMFEAESYVGHKMCRPDDLVINTMWAWMGALGVSSTDGVVSPSYGVYRLRYGAPIASGYLDALLRTPLYVAEYVRRSTGIHSSRLRLYSDEFLRMPVVVPPLEEQTQIAKFLDYETAKIDALIEKQQQLIALLKEKRQAVISHAVTKGLNPDAPMRDSGVEWLGKVPAHWEVSQLGYLTHEVTVGIVVTPAKFYVESGVPCLRSLNVRSGYLRNEDLVYISPQSNELLAKSKIRLGDVVVVRTGQPGTTAMVSETFDGCNCIDLIVIRRTGRIFSPFLVYQMNSEQVSVQVTAGSGGAIQQHFNVGVAKKLRVLCPPVAEQKLIVEYLDHQSSTFDKLIGKAERAVDLLQERRTALISAAVTGKIDVRGWKPPVSATSNP